MNQGSDSHMIPMTSVDSGKLREVGNDVAYYTNQIVNLIMIGEVESKNWILVDAGMPKSGAEIIEAAEKRYGKNNPPSAIVLTHGHFDHVGSIVTLLERWPVPVYAHPLEFPFLTGERSYPEPDTTVEGGLLAKISSIYPVEPVNISESLKPLPPDGSIPGLRHWRWIHVPGHSPGQVALFREADGLLISGDAIITVRQDSMYRVLVQKQEVCGPPVYLTTDWNEAYQSLIRLAALHPSTIISGHGTSMQGEELKAGISNLIRNWKEVAEPDHGKWVDKDQA